MSAWSLRYEGYDPEQEGLREALCTLGNGVFATRGAAPETDADDVHYPGTYAGGVYNRLVTDIEGRDIENEDLVNLPNWLPLTFRIDDGAWFHVDAVDLVEYRQELDMHDGVLIRDLEFEDEAGRRTRLVQRRLVHMGDYRYAALETTITPVGWSGRIEFRSALDGRVENRGVPRYRKLASRHLEPFDQGEVDDETVHVEVETNQSHIRIGEAARVRVFVADHPVDVHRSLATEPGYAAHHFAVDARDGEPIRVEKVVTVITSRHRAIASPGLEAQTWVRRAGDFEDLLESHALAWRHLWRRAGMRIDGPNHNGMALNLHVFHLLQTVSEHSRDFDVGVPARGLHGEAYRGHIFWDELFIFPLLNYRLPELTRELLLYRYRRLPEARWAAREEGHAGAMFPWQSGSDGREESQLVHLNPRSGEWIPDNSRLQRHIGIAVACNVWQYYQVTGDLSFLGEFGAEMLVEIARFFASKTTFDDELSRYRILGVMGPDEYHDGYPDRDEPGLDDNAYTNVMTVWVLLRAYEALEELSTERRRRLRERLELHDDELERWDDITRRMRIPFHDDGIISQFEGYGELEEFDWVGYTERYGDIQRLDRILQAEDDTPNRYKASKQADVLMLFYLLSSEELGSIFTRLGYEWDEGTIPRNVAYYRQRTSHGSTLSRVVHAWVLSRSDRKESWSFFNSALESDLVDIQGGTTQEGIHLGAMAGTVDLMLRCYSGLEPVGDVLKLNPALPEELRFLEFRLRFRGCWLHVRVEQDRTFVTRRPDRGEEVEVELGGRCRVVSPGQTVEWVREEA